MKQILTILLILLFFNVGAQTTYYISASGNDANNGTSTSTPWQTLAKVNAKTKVAGDVYRFNKGDTWYGSLTIAQSGNSSNPITISSYGSGANPVITGFTTVTSWTNLGGNIWESTDAVSTLSNCNVVSVNGINTPMGRYPNTGWRTIGSSTVNSITDNTLDATDWTGGEVVIKMLTYVVDKFTITSQASKTLNFTNSNYTPPVGAGYFIQNDKRTFNYIDFSGNNFTTAQVNALLIWLDGQTFNAGAKTLYVDQESTAPPSGAGITAKNSLVSKGWTVTTD